MEPPSIQTSHHSAAGIEVNGVGSSPWPGQTLKWRRLSTPVDTMSYIYIYMHTHYKQTHTNHLYRSIYLSADLFLYLPPSIYLSIYLAIYLSTYRPSYLATYPSINQLICLPTCLSILYIFYVYSILVFVRHGQLRRELL